MGKKTTIHHNQLPINVPTLSTPSNRDCKSSGIVNTAFLFLTRCPGAQVVHPAEERKGLYDENMVPVYPYMK
jgi:hypothetical protein